MGNVIHNTVPVQVWVDIDCEIADCVRWLNSLPGVRTFGIGSCQGTIGEGGSQPYHPYIKASWPDEQDAAIRQRFEVVVAEEPGRAKVLKPLPKSTHRVLGSGPIPPSLTRIPES